MKNKIKVFRAMFDLTQEDLAREVGSDKTNYPGNRER